MSESGGNFFLFRNSIFLGLQETEFNEFMLVGLGLGISSIVAIGMIIYCRRYKWVKKYKIRNIAKMVLFIRTKKVRRREHPMIPAHSHFHTCESIGE